MDSEDNLKEFAKRLEQRVDRRHRDILRGQRWLIQLSEAARVLRYFLLAGVVIVAIVVLFLL